MSRSRTNTPGRSNLKTSYLTCFELDADSLGVPLQITRSSFSAGYLTSSNLHKSAKPSNRTAVGQSLDATDSDEISLENLDPTELEVKSDTKVLDDLKAMYSKKNMNISTLPTKRIVVPNGCYFSPGPLNISLRATQLKIQHLSRAATAKSGRRPLGKGLNTTAIYPHISVDTTSTADQSIHPENLNMQRLQEQSKQYHMEPMDHDTRTFSKQKKNINEKLKHHWKEELSAVEKGKLRKLNESAFKNEDEWMTIAKPPTDFEQTVEQRNEPMSLIDTFTANIYEPEPQVSNTYQVNSNIGTLIANKLSQGEKIRVGVNGKFVKAEHEKEDLSKLSFNQLFETDKTYNPSSVLSWNQQVTDYSIKVIEPSVKSASSKEVTKKDNRSLVVKKLVDEDEFQPSIVKAQRAAQFNGSETNSMASNISSDDYTVRKQSAGNARGTHRRWQPPVEVVGTNTIGHPFQQHIQTQNKKAEREEAKPTQQATKKVEFKTQVLKQRPPLTLNDKNYSQLVDNLTRRYTEAVVQAKQQKELEAQNQQSVNALYSSMTSSNSSSVGSPKVTTNNESKKAQPALCGNDKLVSSDFVHDLGMNRVNAGSSQLMSSEVKWPALQISSLDSTHLLAFNKCNIEEYNRQTQLLTKDLLTHINQHISETSNKNNNTQITETPLVLKDRLTDTSNIKSTITVDNTSKDTDCVITIKSFVTSSKKDSLPGTPQTYSSYVHAQRSGSSRHIKDFRSRARINVGETSQLSSLGGGFYYNTSKQRPLPSGYYKPPCVSRETQASRCSTSKPRTPAPPQVTRIETKFFNITKPIIMFEP